MSCKTPQCLHAILLVHFISIVSAVLALQVLFSLFTGCVESSRWSQRGPSAPRGTHCSWWNISVIWKTLWRINSLLLKPVSGAFISNCRCVSVHSHNIQDKSCVRDLFIHPNKIISWSLFHSTLRRTCHWAQRSAVMPCNPSPGSSVCQKCSESICRSLQRRGLSMRLTWGWDEALLNILKCSEMSFLSICLKCFSQERYHLFSKRTFIINAMKLNTHWSQNYRNVVRSSRRSWQSMQFNLRSSRP